MRSIRCWKCKIIFPREFVKRIRAEGALRCVCDVCQKKTQAERLIGASGKPQRQPKGKQAKFTSPHNIVPSVVAGYPGRDIRYSVDPSFRGTFSKLGPGRYL